MRWRSWLLYWYCYQACFTLLFWSVVGWQACAHPLKSNSSPYRMPWCRWACAPGLPSAYRSSYKSVLSAGGLHPSALGPLARLGFHDAVSNGAIPIFKCGATGRLAIDLIAVLLEDHQAAGVSVDAKSFFASVLHWADGSSLINKRFELFVVWPAFLGCGFICNAVKAAEPSSLWCHVESGGYTRRSDCLSGRACGLPDRR
jgi:hypothetical protein